MFPFFSGQPVFYWIKTFYSQSSFCSISFLPTQYGLVSVESNVGGPSYVGHSFVSPALKINRMHVLSFLLQFYYLCEQVYALTRYGCEQIYLKIWLSCHTFLPQFHGMTHLEVFHKSLLSSIQTLNFNLHPYIGLFQDQKENVFKQYLWF